MEFHWIQAEIQSLSGFVKSKWEELDPEQVAHQAITTSKWEFEPPPPEPERSRRSSSSGERRIKNVVSKSR